MANEQKEKRAKALRATMANEQEEKREKAINAINTLLLINEFTFEVKAVKKPKGVRVILEVTQEEIDEIAKRLIK